MRRYQGPDGVSSWYFRVRAVCEDVDAENHTAAPAIQGR